LLKKPENIETLTAIIETNFFNAEITDRFSIDKIHEHKNFLSLLYYMGLVTIDKEPEIGMSMLRIPNYSIKTMYWEYMENIIMDRNPKMPFNTSLVYGSLGAMAFYNDYRPFFDMFQKDFVSRLSNRDLEHFSEKNVKLFLLSVLFQTNYYLPLSETENSGGYSDIYLQRRSYLYPAIKADWVWELKYIKQSDAENETLIASRKAEAVAQLKRYRASNLFKDRTDVRYLAVVFIGKKDYLIEEI
jgi:hypothetical protein